MNTTDEVALLSQQLQLERRERRHPPVTPVLQDGELLGMGLEGYLNTPSTGSTTRSLTATTHFEPSLPTTSAASPHSLVQTRTIRTVPDEIRRPPPTKADRTIFLKPVTQPETYSRFLSRRTMKDAFAPPPAVKTRKGGGGRSIRYHHHHIVHRKKKAGLNGPRRTSQLAVGCPVPLKNPLCPATQSKSFELADKDRFWHVIVFGGKIHAGLNALGQWYQFHPPIEFPETGLPSNMIIPLPQEWKSTAFKWQTIGPPKGLLKWWEGLTNKCVGPICMSNQVLDPLTGRCYSRLLDLEPNTATGFESIGLTKLPELERAHRKWRLNHLLIYDTAPTVPEVTLLGVATKGADGKVSLNRFPYPIPLNYRSEFNEEAFSVPEPYRSQLALQLRKQNGTPLDLKQATDILLEMQQAMGDLIALPNSCLLQTRQVGAYVLKEAKCFELLNPKPTGPKAFKAYLTQPHPLYPDKVMVLAGFDNNMRLVFPESEVVLNRNLASAIPAVRVDASRQLDPIMTHMFTEQTLQRLSRSEFLNRLGV